MRDRRLAIRWICCVSLLASVTLALGFGRRCVRAEPDDTPRAIRITPPSPQPLGCRTSRSQLLCKPNIATSALAVLPAQWTDTNPYHRDPVVVATGQQLFNQACAFCHGEDADGSRMPAPDLRRLDAFCTRIADPAIQAWCERDVDAYFVRTVRQGRQIINIVHMPPWEGTLSQQEVWAIKTFIDAQKP
jgi:cytochrome c553